MMPTSAWWKPLTHGGIENDVSVEIQWVDSEGVTDANAAQILGHADGIIVPGGFGDRGIEGMIASARYAQRKRRTLFRHLPGHADGRH